MANKTIRGTLEGWDGTTACLAYVLAENGATSLNGSGDTVTFGALDTFTFVVTESLAGYYDILLVDAADTNVKMSYRGKVHIPADVVGTYEIQSLAQLNRAAFNNQLIPTVNRSADDTNPIRFYWPVANADIDGTVVIIQDGSAGSSQSIAGAITYIGTVDTKYEYNLAYNASDRPTQEGVARYELTDGTNEPKGITLNVFDVRLTAEESAKIALIGTGAGVISSPVYRGKIESIVIGDAYLRANGDDFEFTIPDPGLTVATTTVWFGGNSSTTATSWLVQGTITDNGTTWTLSFELTDTITDALDCGYYKWSVATRDANSKERTRVSSNGQEVTALMHKQTDGSDPNC